MLVLSRIIYGMILGIALILVSELCLADGGDKEFIEDKLSIDHQVATLYKFDKRLDLVGAYRRYQDDEVEADRVFLGLKAKF